METLVILAIVIAALFWAWSQRRKSRRAQPAPTGAAPKLPVAAPAPRPLPSTVLFVDVETTGLDDGDRIVSFAGVLLKTAALAQGRFDAQVAHFICDPGRKSHPGAERTHGYSDWLLRHQDPFANNAAPVAHLCQEADLLVAHNAEFDLRFINSELQRLGLSVIQKPIYCTMKGYRAEGFNGSASLDAVAFKIGLSRVGPRHGALEDAWLAMMIYLWLHGCPQRFPFSAFTVTRPANLVEPPPMPQGRLPRRKSLPTVAMALDPATISLSA